MFIICERVSREGEIFKPDLVAESSGFQEELRWF